jgi:AbrB family looped-hinge helix DNA binding protein
METVKISPKFRVVIPKRARETFNFKAGEELEVCIVDGSIHLRRLQKSDAFAAWPRA